MQQQQKISQEKFKSLSFQNFSEKKKLSKNFNKNIEKKILMNFPKKISKVVEMKKEEIVEFESVLLQKTCFWGEKVLKSFFMVKQVNPIHKEIHFLQSDIQ